MGVQLGKDNGWTKENLMENNSIIVNFDYFL